ncbi:MAPEG family protein [Hahella sp. SMD15-11]|uniref:MAPEG family protein n=1 Tax=Thermohahella caldifontis TaxID=3142973 RepID=A0AB39UX95_9GAMM
MNENAILYPAFAMFALTLFCVFRLGLMRFLAIRQGRVKISFYRTYNEGSQPQDLHLMSRHVQNHFEIPPLFYIGVILTHITGNVSVAAIVLAWLFVAARFVHTFIHLTSNNVSRRFFTFGFSLLCLCGLWVTVLLGLL